MKRSRLLVAALALVAASFVSCKEGRPRVPSGSQSPRVVSAISERYDRFGVVGRTSGDAATRLLDELAVGWIRIPVNWSQIEPRSGSYNWKEVSGAVSSQTRTRPGLHVMVTLRAKSQWAGRRTTGKVSEKATVPPRDLDAYYDFVYGMATRGAGTVSCWQIENEMEGQSWWHGTSEDYLALLRTAHQAVRAADPSAQVALGGFTSQSSTVATFASRGASEAEIARELGSDKGRAAPGVASRLRRNQEFMDDVLKHGQAYFDVVDLHLYHRYETIPMRVEWLRGKMKEYGYEKPIWATEVGGPDPLVAPHDESVQAQEVIKRVSLALASGVDKVFWLGLTEMANQGDRFHRMGLTAVGGRLKPAFRAYQLSVRKLADLPPSSSLDIPGGYGLRFEKGSRVLWVLWADQGCHIALQTGTTRVRVTGVDGREEQRTTPAGSLNLRLTADPVFVEAVPGP